MVVVRISTSVAASPSPVQEGRSGEIVGALRGAIRSIEAGSEAGEGIGTVSLGVPALDEALGGGLVRAAFHEIAAASESALSAASGFALMLAARTSTRTALWIAEDMGLAENGAPHGPGIDEFGLSPERLVTLAAAKPRDVLWAMEEAVRCRAVGAVIGEIRNPERNVDLVASRRLSLATRRGCCALLLRSQPGTDASAAATRWVVSSAASAGGTGPGPPRLCVQLTRNRRGPLGSWILEWNRVERRFVLVSSLSQPLADAAFDRPHRAAAIGA